jgi:hypothetical protein
MGGGEGEAEGALRALERERARGLSAEERRLAEEDLEMLRGLGDPKVDREVVEIEGLLDELGVNGHQTVGNVVQFDALDFLSR